MPKLSKDQTQKMVAGVVFFLLLTVAYFMVLMNPLKAKTVSTRARVAELEQKVGAANQQIKLANDLEVEATKAAETMDQLKEFMPEGAAVAWFPPLIGAFFERHNVKEATTRFITNEEPIGPDLGDFQQFVWSIQLARADFLGLGICLSGLENENPLLEIIEMQIDVSADNVEYQRVSLRANSLLRK